MQFPRQKRHKKIHALALSFIQQIFTICVKVPFFNIIIIYVYAPNSGHVEELEKFYTQLPAWKIKIVQGDRNVKVNQVKEKLDRSLWPILEWLPIRQVAGMLELESNKLNPS